jgi:hypothetical protein
MNERLLRDGGEAIGLLHGLAGEPSSQAVRLWLEFSARPTGRNWYRAHNASIASGYLVHRDVAETENAPERFFMNVALVRVLYAHVLVGAPALALGRWPRSAACWATLGSGWPECSSPSTAWCRTAIRSLLRWSGTSSPSTVSAGCSTTP